MVRERNMRKTCSIRWNVYYFLYVFSSLFTSDAKTPFRIHVRNTWESHRSWGRCGPRYGTIHRCRPWWYSDTGKSWTCPKRNQELRICLSRWSTNYGESCSRRSEKKMTHLWSSDSLMNPRKRDWFQYNSTLRLAFSRRTCPWWKSTCYPVSPPCNHSRAWDGIEANISARNKYARSFRHSWYRYYCSL